MKLAHGTALVAALIFTGLAHPPPLLAAEPADAAQAQEASAAELKRSSRHRAERAQAEAAAHAVAGVLSATKLDLDIRLIGPTSMAGDL